MQLNRIFPSSYDFILAANTTNPQWQTISAYKILPVELQRTWADPHQLIGVRPGNQTNYLLIDVDRTSKYHPYNVSHEWGGLLFGLEQIGLIDPIFLRSSHSQGIHIYYHFAESINSFRLAALVRIWLEQEGFNVTPGQIETFPNTKTYDSKYNAHRLPCQPNSGALLLDQHGDPMYHPANQNHLTQLAYFAQHAAQAQQSLALIKSRLKWGYDEFLKSRYRRGGGGVDVAIWRQNWAETIEQGWTGAGQTNDILLAMVGNTIIFEGIQDKQTIFDRVKSLVLSAPGYREYCGHQHHIDKRIWEWINNTVNRNYYTPYQSHPTRTGKFPGLGITPEQPQRPKSTKRRDQVIHRLTTTVQTIIERLGQLPNKIRDRVQIIIDTSKELFGSGFGNNTLYKACYLGLWGIAETAENRQELETVTGVCRSYICDQKTEPENNVETVTGVCRSYISVPMKVIHSDPERSMNLELDLPQVSTEVLELTPVLPNIFSPAPESDLCLPEPESFSVSERSSVPEQNPLSVQGSSDPESNSLLHRSSDSELCISALFSESISNTYDSSEYEGLDSCPDLPEPDLSSLPPIGASVRRAKQVYRGKTYPELFATITANFGVGCEAIESDAGGRYRFDLCDWLDTWFPATCQGSE